MTPAATNQRRSPGRPPAVPVEALDGERVDDGRRYPIDEWKRLFGDPPMLTTSYDAWAE